MNEVPKVISELLQLVPEISQADLVKDSGINKAQVSQFLNKGVSLGVGKQPLLIESLLKRVDELRSQGAVLAARTDDLVKALQADPLYQAAYGEAIPGLVVFPGNKSHIESPDNLLQPTNSRPFVLGIAGGPKTGKSVIGRGLEFQLRKEPVIFFNCMDYSHPAKPDSSQFVRWLVKTAEKQWPRYFSEKPSDWRGVVQWMKKDILSAKKPCTLIFDHIEALGTAYQDFSSGWHFVLNQSRRESSLDKIGLVLVFDEANPFIYAGRIAASRVEQRMQTIVPKPFAKGALAMLAKAEIAPTSENEEYELSDQIWKLFHGHPYLTHCYIHAYGNAKPSEAMQTATLAAQTAFARDIAPRLLGNVYQPTLRRHFDVWQENMIEFPVVEADHAMLLQDTLLFTELENGNLRCVTPWVQERLIESISSEKLASQ